MKTGIKSDREKVYKSKGIFSNNKITDLTVPEGYTALGEDACYAYSRLTSVTLPSTLTSIEADAFSRCESLEGIILPWGLTRIGERAFSWSGLTSLNLPDGVSVIEKESFFYCRGLKNVKLPEECHTVSADAFAYCSELESIALPDSVISLGEGAFRSCFNLKHVKLPSHLKVIPDRLFENCTSLKELELPESIERIGEHAFRGCRSLTEIKLGVNLHSIGRQAFMRCQSLKAPKLTHLDCSFGDGAFLGCKSIRTLILPDAVRAAGAYIAPDSVCNTPNEVKSMFVTSFLTREELSECPTVVIPKSVTALLPGYETLLSYDSCNADCTCMRHILRLEKENICLFVGKRYYSYDDRTDFIIQNGLFDYKKYDAQFEKAEKEEKPVIAALRLTCGKELSPGCRTAYRDALYSHEKEAAQFAARVGLKEVLLYLLEHFEFDRELLDALYDDAARLGEFEIQKLLIKKPNKNGISELEAMRDALLINDNEVLYEH